MEGYRAHIRKVISRSGAYYYSPDTVRPQSISLGQIFAERVREHPELLELVTPPSFSLSVFRITPNAVPDFSADELNDLNELYYRRIDERKDLWLTQTSINGINCIR